MTTIHLISLISLIIMLTCSAISKAIMDALRFNFSGSVFKNLGAWWDPAESWKRKWKNGDKSQGEAFPGSSTVFVSFTDAWHFWQHLFLLPLFLVPIAYSKCLPLVAWKWYMVTDFMLMYVFFTITFQIFYWIFNKKYLLNC